MGGGREMKGKGKREGCRKGGVRHEELGVESGDKDERKRVRRDVLLS